MFLALRLWRPLQNLVDYPCSFDTGKFDVESVDAVGELFVVHSKLMQNSCVQVVDRDFVDCGFQPEFIGFAMTDATLDTATCKPGCKRIGVVVASGFGPDLGDGQSAELAAAHDERFVEHSALLQIGQQRGDRLVHLVRKATMIALDIIVSIPALLILSAAAVKLDEANAVFDQASGGETLPSEMSTTLIVESVHAMSRRRRAF